MKKRKLLTPRLSLLAVPLLLAATPALADENNAAKTVDTTRQRVASADDDSWITVSGTVTSTTPSSFRLDYGSGSIVVEMDDFDFFQEGRLLMENDQVVVHGRIDDDLFERRTIEASSVFVENLGTHFFASAVDEEGYNAWATPNPIVVGEVEMTGTVTAINGSEVTLNSGLSRIEVDTSQLVFDPLDDQGYLQIDVGDLVKVKGSLESTLLDDHALIADWIVKLD